MKSGENEMSRNGIIYVCIFRSSLVVTEAQSFAISCVRHSNNGRKIIIIIIISGERKNMLNKHYVRVESQLKDPHMLTEKCTVNTLLQKNTPLSFSI